MVRIGPHTPPHMSDVPTPSPPVRTGTHALVSSHGNRFIPDPRRGILRKAGETVAPSIKPIDVFLSPLTGDSVKTRHFIPLSAGAGVLSLVGFAMFQMVPGMTWGLAAFTSLASALTSLLFFGLMLFVSNVKGHRSLAAAQSHLEAMENRPLPRAGRRETYYLLERHMAYLGLLLTSNHPDRCSPEKLGRSLDLLDQLVTSLEDPGTLPAVFETDALEDSEKQRIRDLRALAPALKAGVEGWIEMAGNPSGQEPYR